MCSFPVPRGSSSCSCVPLNTAAARSMSSESAEQSIATEISKQTEQSKGKPKKVLPTGPGHVDGLICSGANQSQCPRCQYRYFEIITTYFQVYALCLSVTCLHVLLCCLCSPNYPHDEFTISPFTWSRIHLLNKLKSRMVRNRYIFV